MTTDASPLAPDDPDVIAALWALAGCPDQTPHGMAAWQQRVAGARAILARVPREDIPR